MKLSLPLYEANLTITWYNMSNIIMNSYSVFLPVSQDPWKLALSHNELDIDIPVFALTPWRKPFEYHGSN